VERAERIARQILRNAQEAVRPAKLTILDMIADIWTFSFAWKLVTAILRAVPFFQFGSPTRVRGLAGNGYPIS
jgi:hypothetical protein